MEDNEIMTEEINTDAVIKIIAYDCETGYAIVDGENTIPCDKIVLDKGREVIHLPSNSTCRQWADKKKVDAAIESDGGLTLAYKARVKIGSTGSKIPNLALIEKYLNEDEVNEYKEIINKAIEAKAADKDKPLSEAEKLEASIKRAEAKLAKLKEEQNGGNN